MKQEAGSVDHSAIKKRSEDGLSLICVWTDEGLLDALRESLAGQTVPIELIALDNRDAKFPNAVSAFRRGIEEAKYANFVFLHQDIEFLDDATLSRLLRLMQDNPLALYGVAGTSGDKREDIILSSIIEGPLKKSYETLRTEVQEASCLDECCFALNECVLDVIGFDERACYGWHFYAVDLSLQAHLHGIPCFVVRSEVWHKSSGTLDSIYWRNQAVIERKYRSSYKSIRPTCEWFPTGFFAYKCHAAKRKLAGVRRKIKANRLL